MTKEKSQIQVWEARTSKCLAWKMTKTFKRSTNQSVKNNCCSITPNMDPIQHTYFIIIYCKRKLTVLKQDMKHNVTITSRMQH